MLGVRLLLLHPELPSCGECQQWLYNVKTWQPHPKRGGKPGEYEPRPGGSPTPCGVCPKIPRDKEKRPENATELSDKNWQAWTHYNRCRAVRRFPEDEIVERNAGLIRMVEEEAKRHGSADGLGLVLSLFARK